MAMSTLDGAFPDSQNAPTGHQQMISRPLVGLAVQQEFSPPENFTARWPAEQFAIMTVPETTIHEYGGVVFRHDEVRVSRQTPLMQPEAEAAGVEPVPDQQFRSGVLGSDAGHHTAPNLGRDDVSHRWNGAPVRFRQGVLRKRRICFGA
jgi:hypothetical protein